MKTGDEINVDYKTMIQPLVGRLVDMEIDDEKHTFRIIGYGETVRLKKVSKDVKD